MKEGPVRGCVWLVVWFVCLSACLLSGRGEPRLQARWLIGLVVWLVGICFVCLGFGVWAGLFLGVSLSVGLCVGVCGCFVWWLVGADCLAG